MACLQRVAVPAVYNLHAMIRLCTGEALILLCIACPDSPTMFYISISLSCKTIFFVQQRNSIHEAASQGDLHTVRHLTDEGTDINIRDDSGVSIPTVFIQIKRMIQSSARNSILGISEWIQLCASCH